VHSQNETKITFVNATDVQVRALWVDFEGTCCVIAG
jgi:hypothetical protein